ncbi:MAG: hypothetical protein ACLR2O_08655 [Coprococcus sp.]
MWIELLDQNLGTLTTDQLTRDAIVSKGQQFMQLGVEVNEDLSVKEETWKGRLFACGDVLTGHNFANERSGAGIAAASCISGRKTCSSSIRRRKDMATQDFSKYIIGQPTV